MTLTTEQLRARAKIWRKKAVDAKWQSVSIAQDMLQNADAFDELADNREARPVALVDRRPAASGGICWQHGGKDLQHGTELFTAPPALAAFPEAKDKSQGWKIDPEYLHAIADAVGSSDDEGTPSMELVEAVLLAAVPPAPAYPERLPCPVHLLPGLKFGKGVPTRSMLDALVRRAEYESELDAMTPEQRAENDTRLEKLKALIPPPAPANARAVAWEMRYWNSGYNCWHDWERITAEQHAEMSVQHAASNDYEFRVLAELK